MNEDYFKLGVSYRLLLAIEDKPDKSISQISRFGNISYSQTHKSLSAMEKKGLVKLKAKDGRSRYAILTGKGKKIATYLRLILQELKTKR